jgi:uncharacterized protein
MSTTFKPESFDPRAFAQASTQEGASLQAEWSQTDVLSKMQRLSEDLCAQTAQNAPNWPEEEVFVRWQAAGYLHERMGSEPQVWLRLALEAALPLQCQRCLQPMIESVAFERDFRFVADEQTAEAQDDESEEDLLVYSKRFDLLALIEDELLMSLPIVPKHELCPEPPKLSVSDAAFEQALSAVKPNAFAVLGSLKKDGKP